MVDWLYIRKDKSDEEQCGNGEENWVWYLDHRGKIIHLFTNYGVLKIK